MGAGAIILPAVAGGRSPKSSYILGRMSKYALLILPRGENRWRKFISPFILPFTSLLLFFSISSLLCCKPLHLWKTLWKTPAPVENWQPVEILWKTRVPCGNPVENSIPPVDLFNWGLRFRFRYGLPGAQAKPAPGGGEFLKAHPDSKGGIGIPGGIPDKPG